MATDPLPPSDSPDDAALELPPADIEALLAQAEQFVREAADELGGRVDAEAPSRPIDLSRPVSPAIVEEQLDEVAALVAKANAEASDWAAFGDESPHASVAGAIAPSVVEPADAAPLADRHATLTTADHSPIPAPPPAGDDTAVADGIVTQAGTRVAQTPAAKASPAPDRAVSPDSADKSPQGDTPQTPVDFSEPQAAEDAAPSGDPPAVMTEVPPVALPSGPLAWPLMLLLGLNAPFRRVGPRGRRMAGMIAIATLLTSGIVWLLPFLL